MVPWSHRAGAARLKSPLHNETLGPEAKCTVTRGKRKRLPSPFCFPTKRYNGNGEFIPPHPFFFFFYSLNPGYKLLTRCGRVIHRSWHYKYYNNLMHKTSPISLKCCLKAHVTYKSGEFPCLHLIAPLLRFWLQRSQLSRATCFIGVTPVWAQGTKKKGIHWNFCCCCFLKIKNVLKKKTKKKNQTWDTSATG